MPDKVWKTALPPPADLAGTLGLPPLPAALLYNRGVTRREQVADYLAVDGQLASDPMLLPDMDAAVARLLRAVDDREAVGVFGDFDTDGVTATAIVTLALEELGVRAVPYIPDREDEGHGLNPEAVSVLRGQGVTVLVTADCGSNSTDEIELASSLGVDTIVTDHHVIHPPMAQAVAVVNPKRPDFQVPDLGLTGAGLAYKLVEALYSELGRPIPQDLIGLAALGTVADVGPLRGENRYIVHKGLEVLNRTRRPGLQALIAKSRLKPGSLDADSLAFWLIPRLNAAGRLGDAGLSLRLLTTRSPSTAESVANELDELNSKRRELTEEALSQAREQLSEDPSEVPPIIIVERLGWLPGILGLIAGRLAEEFYRPAVAVAVDGDTCRASARSIPEFDIIAALEASRELLGRYGGHAQAAGFSMPYKELPHLKDGLTAIAAEQLDGVELLPSVQIDAEVAPSEVMGENYQFMRSMAPFGEANPEPIFVTRDAQVTSARRVGGEGEHLKVQFSYGGVEWNAIAFRQSHEIAPGDIVDVAYNVGVDDWSGTPLIQLNVIDLRVKSRVGMRRD